MKRISLMMATVLPLASICSAANAQAGSPGANREYVQAVQAFCRNIVGSPSFPTLNWGECMSFNVVSEEGFIAHFCDGLREGGLGTLEDFGFADYSDCVRNLEL